MTTFHTDLRSQDYAIEDGTAVWELVRAGEYSTPDHTGDVDVVEIPARQITRPHHHVTFDEIFYVLAGSGRLFLADGVHEIAPGTCFLVRRRESHSFAVGPEPLRLLTVSLPRFVETDCVFEDAIGSPYLLVDACAYCWGAASTSASVLTALDPAIEHVILLGSGSVLEFFSDHPRIRTARVVETESLAELEAHRDLVANARLCFINSNSVTAVLARALGVPVVYLDILPWLCPTVDSEIRVMEALHDNAGRLGAFDDPAALLANAECYIRQAYFTPAPLDPRIAHPLTVPPIVAQELERLVAAPPPREDRLLISLGGFLNPDGSHEPLMRYLDCLADAAVAAAGAQGLEEVWICGPEAVARRIRSRAKRPRLAVQRLGHGPFLRALMSSQRVAIVPGLTGIYEAFFSGVPTLLLPPTNYTQVHQVDRVRRAGLAGPLTPSAWPQEVDREILASSEIAGTRRMLEVLDAAARDGRLYAVLAEGFHHLGEETHTSATTRARVGFMSGGGVSGARRVAEAIEEIWYRRSTPP